jgi:hypothetical protein
MALRIPNRSLKAELQLFAVHGRVRSLRDASADRIWQSTGPSLIAALNDSDCTLHSEVFPDDGSYMKKSQVLAFCKAFGLADPAPILKEVWGNIDAVVVRRNGVAHGRLTAEEVGREYTIDDLRALTKAWRTRWLELVDSIETQARPRSFYRSGRR